MQSIESQDGKNMIPRRQQGTALTIVIIILAVFVSMTIPLSPTLTITVVVNTTLSPLNTSGAPLTVTTYTYSRVPLSVAIVTPQNTISMIGGPSTSGSGTLAIAVTYGTAILSPSTQFPNLADGTYQFKVLYAPRSEDPTVPYVVSLTLSFNGQSYSVTQNIFP